MRVPAAELTHLGNPLNIRQPRVLEGLASASLGAYLTALARLRADKYVSGLGAEDDGPIRAQGKVLQIR